MLCELAAQKSVFGRPPDTTHTAGTTGLRLRLHEGLGCGPRHPRRQRRAGGLRRRCLQSCTAQDELCCPTRNIKPSEGTGGHARVGGSRNEKGYGAQGGRGAHQGRDEGGSRQGTVAATRRAARRPAPKTTDSPAATRFSWGPFPSAFLTSRNRFPFSKVHHRAAKRVGLSRAEGKDTEARGRYWMTAPHR